MCGIVGIWSQSGCDPHHLRRELEGAVTSLRHRGPDDRGIWLDDKAVGLGHARLSILDLSPLGHQPMVSADGRYVIVFNGEIYNFREIRARLAERGHTFRGTGDTEVVLAAFQEWGSAAVEQFLGMFAIAIWDNVEQTLELTRDRIGVKPLYYGWHGGTLCFASELKALRKFGHWTPSLDLQAIGEFLQYGFISEDRCIYQGIHKLRPGHRLRLKRGHAPQLESYWSILHALDDPLDGTDKEIELALETLLIDSFKLRMVSDVPVGVYLSGGVDSSLVTAILAKHSGCQLRTFTVGFAESSHDESLWARRVADHCGTLHTEYVLGQSEALEIARNWGGLFDEPFGDSSGIPTLLVSQLASRDVKVVLSADGGDELFSGYNSYTSVLGRLSKLHRLPPWLATAAASALSAVPLDRLNHALVAVRVPASLRGGITHKARRLHAMLSNPTAGRLIDLDMSYWDPSALARMLGSYEPPRQSADLMPGTPATQISLWDFHHYLPEDILTKVDRTTMAVSIEGREPLLDHRVAEYAFRLPAHMRRGALGPKHVLKSILYRYVPRTLVDRPKQGFAIPLQAWLKGELKEMTLSYLSPARIADAGIMDRRVVQQAVSDFYDGDSRRTTPIWLLLAFEMWREQWH